jgi:hypothetical protein
MACSRVNFIFTFYIPLSLLVSEIYIVKDGRRDIVKYRYVCICVYMWLGRREIRSKENDLETSYTYRKLTAFWDVALCTRVFRKPTSHPKKQYLHGHCWGEDPVYGERVYWQTVTHSSWVITFVMRRIMIEIIGISKNWTNTLLPLILPKPYLSNVEPNSTGLSVVLGPMSSLNRHAISKCFTLVFPKLLLKSGCFWTLKISDFL